MPRTGLNLDDEGGVTTKALRRELRVFERIGEGGYGRVYKARFKGRALVAKLPIPLLTDFEEPNGCGLKAVMLPRAEISRADLKAARSAFRKECRNAEKVLDPLLERVLRNQRIQQAGAPLLWSQRTEEERDAIVRQRTLRRSAPGYAHMHPDVHLDRKIPLLLSEPADGNLYALRFVLRANGRLSRRWMAAARQLADAVAFLRDHTGLAHIDIKPGNVFYKHTLDPKRPHIWLGDYGLMAPKDAPYTFGDGTLEFSPPPRLYAALQRDGFTNGQAQLFGYYTTVLDLIGFVRPTQTVDYLSNEDFAHVSERLLDAIRLKHTLFTYAPPELYVHIMTPLFDPSLYVLDVLFERTHAWLRTLS